MAINRNSTEVDITIRYYDSGYAWQAEIDSPKLELKEEVVKHKLTLNQAIKFLVEITSE